MSMRLRQVALVAHDLEPATEALCDVLGIEVGFQDPGVGTFGLTNGVMPVGDTFLEVVSPSQQGTSAGRQLERRGGDGGYMVIVQSDAPEADRQRMQDLGVRIVWEATLEDIGTLHLHPRDVGGAILSIDWAEPPESWRWAGPEWREHVHEDVTTRLESVTIQSPDPAAMAARWAEVLARPSRAAADGGYEIPLDAGCVRFVAQKDGRGEGVSAVGVAVADPEAFRSRAEARGALQPDGSALLCGTRFEPIPND